MLPRPGLLLLPLPCTLSIAYQLSLAKGCKSSDRFRTGYCARIPLHTLTYSLAAITMVLCTFPRPPRPWVHMRTSSLQKVRSPAQVSTCRYGERACAPSLVIHLGLAEELDTVVIRGQDVEKNQWEERPTYPTHKFHGVLAISLIYPSSNATPCLTSHLCREDVICCCEPFLNGRVSCFTSTSRRESSYPVLQLHSTCQGRACKKTLV